MKNIVIGSGPAGRLGSLELGKLGKEVTLIEKNHIAGTCLNEGCMVICALTDITKFIENNNKFNSYGFIKSQLDISYEKIVEKITETQKMLRKINEEENKGAGNNIVYGEAEINGSQVGVNGESFDWDNLLIATGARPFIPDIPGSQYGLTNRDILKIDKVPEKVVTHTTQVDVYDKFGNFIETVDSIKETKIKYNLNSGKLRRLDRQDCYIGDYIFKIHRHKIVNDIV